MRNPEERGAWTVEHSRSNLLGLRVELNQVRLNIAAVPGPGNLLGSLLCAVAGLLDGVNLNSRLQQIADLLNAILALFG